jgi:hypothetical protein
LWGLNDPLDPLKAAAGVFSQLAVGRPGWFWLYNSSKHRLATNFPTGPPRQCCRIKAGTELALIGGAQGGKEVAPAVSGYKKAPLEAAVKQLAN